MAHTAHSPNATARSTLPRFCTSAGSLRNPPTTTAAAPTWTPTKSAAAISSVTGGRCSHLATTTGAKNSGVPARSSVLLRNSRMSITAMTASAARTQATRARGSSGTHHRTKPRSTLIPRPR